MKSKHPLRTPRFLAIYCLIVSLAAAPIAQAQQNRILVPVDEKPQQTVAPTGARAQKPQLVLQTGLTEPAVKLAFNTNGSLLAAMSVSGSSIKLWDTASGHELLALRPKDGSGNYYQYGSDFAFGVDGKSLIAFAAGMIRVWDATTGRLIREASLFDGKENGLAQFSQDGRRLATFGQETAQLRVWDAATGALLQSQSYREQPEGKSDVESQHAMLESLAFSPDGRLLALGESMEEMMSNGLRIVLRDVASWKTVRTITLQATVSAKDQRKEMSGMSRDALDAMLKGRSSGGASAAPSSIASQIDPPRVVAIRFSPDGQMLVSLKSEPGPPQTRKIAAGFYDATTGRAAGAAELPAMPDEGIQQGAFFPRAGTIAFSPDGKTCLAAAGDSSVKLLAIPGARVLAALAEGSAEKIAATFDASGRSAAVSGIDGSITIWDVSNAAANGRVAIVRTLASPASAVSAVAFAGDGGSLVVASPEGVNQWDLRSGTAARTVAVTKQKMQRATEFFDRSHLADLSGDGKQFFTSDKRAVRVFDARTGAPLREMQLQTKSSPDRIEISRDGGRLAFTSRYDPAPMLNNLLGSFGGAAPAVVAPDSTNSSNPQKPDDRTEKKSKFPGLGGPGGFGGIIRPQSAPKQSKADRKEIERLNKEITKKSEEMQKAYENGETAKAGQLMQEVQALMAQMMEASGQSGAIMPFPMPQAPPQPNQRQSVSQRTNPLTAMVSNSEGIKVLDAKDGREVVSIKPQDMMEAATQSVALSADGRLAASAMGFYKIRLTDLTNGKELTTIDIERSVMNEDMAFSPDGRLLATVNLENRSGVNQSQMNLNMNQRFLNTLRIWDVSNPAGGVRQIRAIEIGDFYPTVVFSPDGRSIAVCSTDVKFYDIADGRETLKLAGHTQPVATVVFSPDGKQIVTGGEDGSARLWNAQSGELMATLVHLNGGADWLVVTPDGLFDGTPGAWNQILWRFSQNIYDVTPVEVYFSDFFYPGLLAEIYAGNAPRAAKDVTQKDRRQPQVAMSLIEGQSGAARNVKVKIEVSEAAPGAGARDLRLFRNGTLVKVWRGDLLKGQPRATLEAQLPIVAGENRITAYAFNRDNVKSADALAMVTGAESLRRKGVAYVLAFGVNQYANAQYNLKYAVADAHSFADEVRAQQTKLQQYERVEIVSLVDREATKANILLALKRLSNAATALPAGAPAALSKLQPTQPEDAVVLYFAGHGTAQGKRFYLVPHDLGYAGARDQLSPMAVQMILARSISDLELESALETVDASQLLFVLDACNSGQALEAEEKRRGPMNSSGLAQLAYEKGMYILTAAQSYQVALEAAQLGHGYLTFALVEEGLKKGMADRDLKDGQVLAREWFNYAAERVPQMQQQNLNSRLLLEEETKKASSVRTVQRPRVFFRRELETRPLVVARP